MYVFHGPGYNTTSCYRLYFYTWEHIQTKLSDTENLTLRHRCAHYDAVHIWNYLHVPLATITHTAWNNKTKVKAKAVDVESAISSQTTTRCQTPSATQNVYTYIYVLGFQLIRYC